ncbi:MAG: ABC transporter permease [Clostridia bacterium]|nr:ABC transporter permease [Clostridia bacterium]
MRHSIIKKHLSKVVGVVAWLLIWQLAAYFKDNLYIFPSPKDTLQAFFRLSKERAFFESIALTLYRVFAGFSISLVFGVVLGVFSGLNHWVRDFLKPIITVIRATPVISVIIIIILLAKSSNTPIVVGVFMCFPIIWTNTYEGILNTDKKLLEMAHCFQVSRKNIIKGIYLPSVRPYLISGVMASIGIAWKVTVASEVIGFTRNSIGRSLYESKMYAETPDVFAWTLVVVILSFIFEYFIKYLLKKFNKVGVSSD